jgi:hypothetical protein
MRRTILALTGATVLSIVLATGTALLIPNSAYAAATSPPLGTAANFAVLGASTVTSTGPSVVTGDLGVSPGTAVTGFPPGMIDRHHHYRLPARGQHRRHWTAYPGAR